ncbi:MULTISPECIES: ATP-dependent helicase [unclassified Microbacterium]|uniref:ATP-dependent helicase n=1 Tax=unclassified Microbacterium TaxID=2609290 RepID=UPI003010613C
MRIQPEEWRPTGVDELEKAAWDALRAGTASVAAGPGAGKTEFLAQRAAYLLETNECRSPTQILAISFKRSAAANLQDRVAQRVPEHADRFKSMTFDAFTKALVDRFANVLPPFWSREQYKIDFASQNDTKVFLGVTGGAAPPTFRSDVYSLSADSFLASVVGSWSLPPELGEPVDGAEFAIHEWWKARYLNEEPPLVDFVMLNRLAELIVRTSPQLRRALAVTYPFVFIDEFQDTTYAQYTFLKTLFGGTGATVTVVGDRKQRIMGWAGAMDNAFEEFKSDFGAASFELVHNYRSSAELVKLQHRFAKILAPDAAEQVSQRISDVADASAQVWNFSSAQSEARKIAAWIEADIADSGRRPADYAVLARQKVADLEPHLAAAFGDHGLRVRNDDAEVGQIRLQDLLADSLVRLHVALIRLATSGVGEPDAWRFAMAVVEEFIPEGREADLGSTAEDSLSAHIRELRSWFASHADDLVSKLDLEDLARELMHQTGQFVTAERIGNSRTLAESAGDADLKLAATQIRLAQTLARCDTWNSVPDAFMDEDAVRLMTVHRSKGLEYHSVFIIGLDDEQWWSHRRNVVESTMTFFVGVSRAAERIIFSRVTTNSSSNLEQFFAELEAAGVPTLDLG